LLLLREPVDALSYADWAMKFVPLEKEMTRLRNDGGFKSFDPYLFDTAMVQKVMNLLRTSVDQATAPEVETLLRQSMEPAMEPAAVGRSSAVVWLIAAAVFGIVIVAGMFALR